MLSVLIILKKPCVFDIGGSLFRDRTLWKETVTTQCPLDTHEIVGALLQLLLS